MIKILKYTEYIYLIIAIIAAYELWQFWNVDRNRAYLFLFFAVVSLGMFLFRRRYRKRFERRRDEENS